MSIRIIVSAMAMAALVSACGGGPEGDPTPSPEPPTTAGGGPSTGAPARFQSGTSSSGGGKVHCPNCPIQCDPGDICGPQSTQ
jgi:hypothetical protein